MEELGIRLQNSPAYTLNDMLKTLYHEGTRMKCRNILRKNASLKNIYSEKDRCFIVGNGPSLEKQDLSFLANEHVFVVNWFYKHESFHKISPEYYSFIDQYALTDYKYGLYSRYSEWWRQLNKALEKSSRTKLFLSLNNVDSVVKHHLFKNTDVYYLLPSLDMNKYGIRKVDLCGRIPSGISVIIASMLIAYYVGFRNMILIGCDCSWAAFPVTKKEHFYSEDYHGRVGTFGRVETFEYEKILSCTLDDVRGYRVVKNFLVPRGCKIYNATHGGFLDIFPRVEYEQLFK